MSTLPIASAAASNSTVLGLTAVLSLGLAAIHLFARRFLVLDVIPRSRWLSVAGGASVGYTAVLLLL